MPLIEVHGLKKGYQMGDVHIDVLQNVELVVEPGEFIILYGPSGSGKTTLLNVIAGIDGVDAGTVHVGELDVAAASVTQLTQYRREAVGYIFQFYNLVPSLTALENVAIALELLGIRDDSRARKAMADVGLAGKEDRFPSQLSGGEQQRVAIARALVKRPALVAGDEPTGNLDAATSTGVIDLLRDLNRNTGLTVIVATHDPTLAALGTRVVRIENGALEEMPRTTGVPVL